MHHCTGSRHDRAMEVYRDMLSGPVARRDIPGYMARFEACLIPSMDYAIIFADSVYLWHRDINMEEFLLRVGSVLNGTDQRLGLTGNEEIWKGINLGYREEPSDPVNRDLWNLDFSADMWEK